MKRFLFTIFLLGVLSPLAAQLYHPGEQLFYRVSYKAKMFPNTEVGTVEVKTSEDTADGKSYYKVEGCLLYTSPSPRDRQKPRMPSSA